jgi:phosphate/sulfate permease
LSMQSVNAASDADNSTKTSTPQIIITPPPQTITVLPSTSLTPPAPAPRKTNIAAIVVPVIVVPLIAGVIAFVLLRRRRTLRRAELEAQNANHGPDFKSQHEIGGVSQVELQGDLRERQEVQGGVVEKYAYELQTTELFLAELAGSDEVGKTTKDAHLPEMSH